jgi:dolichol-phosphate mannosyltransferase
VRCAAPSRGAELTVRALRHGLTVVELPIVFRERERGESKMSGLIALEAAVLVPRLRYGRRRVARRIPPVAPVTSGSTEPGGLPI